MEMVIFTVNYLCYNHFFEVERLDMKRAAFTMVELTMVIVIIGILAALALPRMERDIRQEAGDNILSAIRHAQHMALMDNVTDPRYDNWQRSFWRFGFQKCSDNGYFYTISSDKNREGNIDSGEEAVDPLNGLKFNGSNTSECTKSVQDGSSPNIFITKKYGIPFVTSSGDSGVTFNNCGASTAKYIGFDHMGRPHRGFTASSTPDYATLVHADCTITFKFEDSSIEDLVITVEKQTGHAFINGQSDS